MNPFSAFRDRILSSWRVGYNILKLRNPRDLAEFVRNECDVLISPVLRRELDLAHIIQICTNRLDQTDHQKVDYFRDHELQFTFKFDGEAVQVALGDFGLREINKMKDRQGKNIERATRENGRFLRVCSVIEPLLTRNPEWSWKDAVAYLDAHGGPPDV